MHKDFKNHDNPKIIAILANEEDETYLVEIKMKDRVEAGEFLQSMWKHVDGSYYPGSADKACGEWTDRARNVRSTVGSGINGCYVRIRTHAWSADADRRELDRTVLEFLLAAGFDL